MWPSTTKRATPTSSQDDRRRPFIVVRLVSGQRHVKHRQNQCYCYIKMSWGNCYVKVSSPHGDFHDEPEGVAPGRLGGGRVGRADQQPGRRGGPAYVAPAVSATQGAVSRGGRAGPPASWPGAALAPSLAGEQDGPGPSPPEWPLPRLQ